MTKFYYEDFGCCALCKLRIRSGPVVVAEIKHDEPSSFAHAQCWVDAGGSILRTDELSRAMIDKANEIGFTGLVDGNDYTQPPRQNHVRDAVEANR